MFPPTMPTAPTMPTFPVMPMNPPAMPMPMAPATPVTPGMPAPPAPSQQQFMPTTTAVPMGPPAPTQPPQPPRFLQLPGEYPPYPLAPNPSSVQTQRYEQAIPMQTSPAARDPKRQRAERPSAPPRSQNIETRVRRAREKVDALKLFLKKKKDWVGEDGKMLEETWKKEMGVKMTDGTKTKKDMMTELINDWDRKSQTTGNSEGSTAKIPEAIKSAIVLAKKYLNDWNDDSANDLPIDDPEEVKRLEKELIELQSKQTAERELAKFDVLFQAYKLIESRLKERRSIPQAKNFYGTDVKGIKADDWSAVKTDLEGELQMAWKMQQSSTASTSDPNAVPDVTDPVQSAPKAAGDKYSIKFKKDYEVRFKAIQIINRLETTDDRNDTFFEKLSQIKSVQTDDAKIEFLAYYDGSAKPKAEAGGKRKQREGAPPTTKKSKRTVEENDKRYERSEKKYVVFLLNLFAIEWLERWCNENIKEHAFGTEKAAKEMVSQANKDAILGVLESDDKFGKKIDTSKHSDLVSGVWTDENASDMSKKTRNVVIQWMKHRNGKSILTSLKADHAVMAEQLPDLKKALEKLKGNRSSNDLYTTFTQKADEMQLSFKQSRKDNTQSNNDAKLKSREKKDRQKNWVEFQKDYSNKYPYSEDVLNPKDVLESDMPVALTRSMSLAARQAIRSTRPGPLQRMTSLPADTSSISPPPPPPPNKTPSQMYAEDFREWYEGFYLAPDKETWLMSGKLKYIKSKMEIREEKNKFLKDIESSSPDDDKISDDVKRLRDMIPKFEDSQTPEFQNKTIYNEVRNKFVDVLYTMHLGSHYGAVEAVRKHMHRKGHFRVFPISYFRAVATDSISSVKLEAFVDKPDFTDFDTGFDQQTERAIQQAKEREKRALERYKKALATFLNENGELSVQDLERLKELRKKEEEEALQMTEKDEEEEAKIKKADSENDAKYEEDVKSEWKDVPVVSFEDRVQAKLLFEYTRLSAELEQLRHNAERQLDKTKNLGKDKRDKAVETEYWTNQVFFTKEWTEEQVDIGLLGREKIGDGKLSDSAANTFKVAEGKVKQFESLAKNHFQMQQKRKEHKEQRYSRRKKKLNGVATAGQTQRANATKKETMKKSTKAAKLLAVMENKEKADTKRKERTVNVSKSTNMTIEKSSVNQSAVAVALVYYDIEKEQSQLDFDAEMQENVAKAVADEEKESRTQPNQPPKQQQQMEASTSTEPPILIKNNPFALNTKMFPWMKEGQSIPMLDKDAGKSGGMATRRAVASIAETPFSVDEHAFFFVEKQVYQATKQEPEEDQVTPASGTGTGKGQNKDDMQVGCFAGQEALIGAAALGQDEQLADKIVMMDDVKEDVKDAEKEKNMSEKLTEQDVLVSDVMLFNKPYAQYVLAEHLMSLKELQLKNKASNPRIEFVDTASALGPITMESNPNEIDPKKLKAAVDDLLPSFEAMLRYRNTVIKVKEIEITNQLAVLGTGMKGSVSTAELVRAKAQLEDLNVSSVWAQVEAKRMLQSHFGQVPGQLAIPQPHHLPIRISAPPRVGKSATALMMATLAKRMGMVSFYSVYPNKVSPLAETVAKLNRLGWRERRVYEDKLTQAQKRTSNVEANAEKKKDEAQAELNYTVMDFKWRTIDSLFERNGKATGMKTTSKAACSITNKDTDMVLYSSDETSDVVRAGALLASSRMSSTVVFHIRDEAQGLAKEEDNPLATCHSSFVPPPQTLQYLRYYFGNLYGLNCLVTATLFPTFLEPNLWGFFGSVQQNASVGLPLSASVKTLQRTLGFRFLPKVTPALKAYVSPGYIGVDHMQAWTYKYDLTPVARKELDSKGKLVDMETPETYVDADGNVIPIFFAKGAQEGEVATLQYGASHSGIQANSKPTSVELTAGFEEEV